MVGLGTIGLVIGAAVLVAVVYFRREFGETGVFLGRGLSAFGTGFQTALSSVLSPQITPKFLPTIGLNIVGSGGFGGEGGCFLKPFLQDCPSGYHIGGWLGSECCPDTNIGGYGSGAPASSDDRQGGRNINVGASGRQGLPPQPMVVPIGRLGAREPREQRVFSEGAFRVL